MFIAYEKGYFKDEGLNVQLTQFSSVVDENNALASGKVDVMAGGVGEPLNLIQKGKNLTVIGGIMAGDSAVISNASEVSELQDISNFQNKTVATVKTSTGDVVWRAALKNAGINESSINIVEYKTLVMLYKQLNLVKQMQVSYGLHLSIQLSSRTFQ